MQARLEGRIIRRSGPMRQDVQDAKRINGSARRVPQDPCRQQPEGEAACTIHQAAQCWYGEWTGAQFWSNKFAGTAVKGKANKPKFAPSYFPARQETNSDSEPKEGQSAALALVTKIPKRIDYRAMNAHYCNAAQNGSWSKFQSANGDSVRYSHIASICLDDDDLVGNHLTSEGPTSSPQAPKTSNPLSLYASFLAFLEQRPKSGCDQLSISVLRNGSENKQDDKMGDSSPLLSIGASLYD